MEVQDTHFCHLNYYDLLVMGFDLMQHKEEFFFKFVQFGTILTDERHPLGNLFVPRNSRFIIITVTFFMTQYSSYLIVE